MGLRLTLAGPSLLLIVGKTTWEHTNFKLRVSSATMSPLGPLPHFSVSTLASAIRSTAVESSIDDEVGSLSMFYMPKCPILIYMDNLGKACKALS
jgi:hypothetical protein